MRNTVFIVSLGCPKNLVDTEVMAGLLLTNGFMLAEEPAQADLYLINTCAFLPEAREEAYENIREAIRWKKKRKSGRRIVVTGCLSQKISLDELYKSYPEVDIFLPVDAIGKLAEILQGAAVPHCSGSPTFLADETMPRLLLTMPHVAFLKIADGCNNCCAYCSIPGIRGHLRCRTQESILKEARDLVDGGAKELVLIAQDITAYDQPGGLGALLRKLNDVHGDFRIRLLYTHPAHYTDDFITAMAECKKVIPYLDIPLQHISDRILKAQFRRVTAAETRALLKKLRTTIPDLVLRTTFITGLPGETEAEFEELKDFIREQRFERCGVFAYSPEPDTPAANYPDQIPYEIARTRADELLELQQSIMLERNREWIGKKDRVLIDQLFEEGACGRGSLDAPEIDNQVWVTAPYPLEVGQFYDIIYTEADEFELHGEIQ